MARPKPKPMDQAAAPAAWASMMVMNPAATAAWQDVMSESLAFLNGRFEEDQKIPGRLMACRTPVEVMEVQTDFASKAFKEYSEGAMQIAQLMAKATETTAKEFMSGHSRAYDDVPI
ncbi:phasin family protein [Shimia ponticola]|uniref:phasin family protein n=1 Tax=Shimia ponticola TaxID=2582893 RepID=UPI00164C6B83|nr:phasin family protein [Shimia ponticola]